MSDSLPSLRNAPPFSLFFFIFDFSFLPPFVLRRNPRTSQRRPASLSGLPPSSLSPSISPPCLPTKPDFPPPCFFVSGEPLTVRRRTKVKAFSFSFFWPVSFFLGFFNVLTFLHFLSLFLFDSGKLDDFRRRRSSG